MSMSHPFNFIRLILGKQYPDDNENNNRYIRAKKSFDSWYGSGWREYQANDSPMILSRLRMLYTDSISLSLT